MANITVSASNPVISVASTLSNVAVSDVDSGQLVTSISTSQSNVTVSSTSTEVTVGGLAAVANTVIRSAVSASDNGGDGSFTYDQPTGVFTYTGPSASEVRAHFSNTSPITYSSSTGVIGVDPDALFSGKTTDDLPQGSTNKYFSTSGAAVNTDNLAEGSTNLYFTNTNFDNRFATKTTDDLTEGSSNLYFTTARVDTEIDNYTGDFKNVNDIVANGLALEGGGTNTGVVINYQNPSSNPSDQGLVFDRPGATANAYIVWSETGGDKWLFSDGSNVYTMPRTTTDLTEGANLYYSNARVLAYIVDNGLDFNAEKVDDQVANLLVAGNSIDLTYDDSANTLTIDYQEDVVSNGNQFGDVSFNINAGTIHKATLIGDITGITLANISAGDSATLLFTQDLTGSHILDTTTTPSNWTNWDFADNNTELSQDPSAEDVISVIYDGTTYYASIVSMEDVSIPNSSLSNSNVIINGTTFTLGTSGTLNTFNTDVTINGNLEVQGNIDYVNSEDLLVKDQSITLNYGNATARDAFIYVDRSGSVLNNAHIKWNETSDQWEIYDGTSTYKIPTSTTDLAEGTNLYYTQSRFDTAFSNKTTTDLTEGTNLYYTDARVEAYLSGNTSTINADTIEANAFIGGTFTGEGSDLTDVRAESVEVTLKNNTGTQIDKGYPVHAIDYSGSGEVVCILADAGNAETMPAHFIAQDNLTAGGGTGRGILAGRIQNVNTGAFTEGDTIFVAVGGGYANVAPSGEANLIQNLGVVTRIDASNGGGEIMGAGRTAATPNLDDGKFFLGNASNKSTTAVFTDESNTAFDARNLDSSSRKLIDNVWAKDFGITDNLAGGAPNYYFPNNSPGSAGQFLQSTGANQLGFSDFTDESNTAIADYLIDSGTQKKAHTVFVQDLALSPDPANATLGFYMPNGSGTTGQVLKFDSSTQLTQAFLDTGNVTETTNLFYTDARANSAFDARLIDTSVQKKAHTVFVQDLALSPDPANATLGFYMPNGSGTAGQVLKFDNATQVSQAFLDTGNVTETTNLFYTDARVQSNTAADTGLVHTTGDETIAGTKTFTNVIKSIPAGSNDGLIIENDNSSTPFLFTSNAQGTNPLSAQPGVRMRWQQSADGELGGTIEARKTRGNIAASTATEFGDQVFNFNVLPFTNGTFKEGVRLGFDVEHTSATSGAGGGAVTTIFDNAEYGKDFTTTKLLHTSSGSFKVGPGSVDINPTQFRNRGNTIIGNGGDTNYISVADTEAKLIFDKSNVSSTSNVALRIEGAVAQYVWALAGITTGSYGWGIDTGDLNQYDEVTIVVDGAKEYNGGVVEAGKLPDGMPITIGGTTRASGTTFFNAFLTNAEGNTYYIKKYHNDSPGIGSGASNKVVYALFNDAALTSPLRFSVLDSSAWGSPPYYGIFVGYGAPQYPGVYNGGGHIEYGTKPAQGNVFINSGSWTTTGSGANSKFMVNRWEGSYNTINFATPSGGYGGSFATAPGDGHAVSDTITIDGANLKGITSTNNLTFTVDSVDGGGAITSIGNISGTAYQITDQEWSFEMDQTTDNLYVKDDGTTAVTFTPSEVNFATIPVLPSYSNTSLPSAGTAGGMIYVTNGNDKPAYSNGSAWLYTFDNSAVT